MPHEDTIISQNPELGLKNGDLKPKFIFTTKRKSRNLVVEDGYQTRKQLLQKKIKIG